MDIVKASPAAAEQVQMIFLLGPPGVGKTTLGKRACDALGLEFVDLAEAAASGDPTAPDDAGLERLRRTIERRAADVVAVPWSLQRERAVLALLRESGTPLLLWAHPEDMQARSGRDERLFTPVPRLKVRGGFGRSGTGCREFRQLSRACEECLMLVDLSLEDAMEEVRDCISAIRDEHSGSAVEREGLGEWADEWRRSHGARPQVIEVIIDAMACYLLHLRRSGSSPRALAGIRSDLDAAGHLVLMYDVPKDGRVLEHFRSPPWEFEFSRKFTSSPALAVRYRRSLLGFAGFLEDTGRVPSDD